MITSFSDAPSLLWFGPLSSSNASIHRPPMALKDEIPWSSGFCNHNQKSMDRTIYKLAFSATVYHLWGERNNRLSSEVQV